MLEMAIGRTPIAWVQLRIHLPAPARRWETAVSDHTSLDIRVRFRPYITDGKLPYDSWELIDGQRMERNGWRFLGSSEETSAVQPSLAFFALLRSVITIAPVAGIFGPAPSPHHHEN